MGRIERSLKQIAQAGAGREPVSPRLQRSIDDADCRGQAAGVIGGHQGVEHIVAIVEHSVGTGTAQFVMGGITHAAGEHVLAEAEGEDRRREGRDAVFRRQRIRGDERRRHIFHRHSDLIKCGRGPLVAVHTQAVGSGIAGIEGELQRPGTRSHLGHLLAIGLEQRQIGLRGLGRVNRHCQGIRSGGSTGDRLGIAVGTIPDAELAVGAIEIAIGGPLRPTQPVVDVVDGGKLIGGVEGGQQNAVAVTAQGAARRAARFVGNREVEEFTCLIGH